ncbi:hypothetical protein VII00023_06497 [Vibrio ichthyoenteri ATCC 700023]|uniref:DUF2628 domain-containing protein n=2 Tax=Vibrio ichthyoenteri TaxID=142461 RepID=F9S6L1_9VIBR|nr:hypothetical protein VII00023_06497 [Vibrio ichthyoenteri ATCC 700023]
MTIAAHWCLHNPMVPTNKSQINTMTDTTEQPQNIDELNVSDKWKRRFKLYAALNADTQGRDTFVKTQAFKQLTWRERYSLTSNLWAFFGGFIYYFIKGMHYKGAMVLTLTMLWGSTLSLIDFLTGMSVPSSTYWIAPGAACSMLASLDYYRKIQCGEIMWASWPNYFHKKSSVITLAIASIALNIGSVMFILDHEYYTDAVTDIKDAVQIKCGLNRIYALPSEVEILGEQGLCSLLD